MIKTLYKTLPYDIKEYVESAIDLCGDHGVKVVFKPQNSVYKDQNCSGLFEYLDRKQITVAVGNSPWESWFPEFIHEFCHFQQWKNDTKIWNYDKDNLFMGWVAKEIHLTKDEQLKYYKACRNIELDCERRVITTIKKYNFPISLNYYYRKSNFYISMYTFMYEKREWYTPPKYSTIFEQFLPNDRFLSVKEFDNPPNEFRELAFKYCFRK